MFSDLNNRLPCNRKEYKFILSSSLLKSIGNRIHNIFKIFYILEKSSCHMGFEFRKRLLDPHNASHIINQWLSEFFNLWGWPFCENHFSECCRRIHLKIYLTYKYRMWEHICIEMFLCIYFPLQNPQWFI